MTYDILELFRSIISRQRVFARLALALLVIPFIARNAPAATSAATPMDFKTREAKALRIKKDYGIYIVRYEADSDTFMVRLENAPAVGPNVTTLEWLLKGIDNGSTVKDFRRHPQRLVGGYFRLKNPLWLLSDEEIEERRAQKTSKRNK